jgi:serine O-acetyltransferase
MNGTDGNNLAASGVSAPEAPARHEETATRHGEAHGIDDSYIARAFKPVGTVADDLPSDDKLGTVNQNPTGISLWDLWREDLRTHDGELFSQGFWAIALHRFGNWRMGVRPRFLRVPLSIVYKIAYKWVEWTCGISLNYPVKVGRRVRIWHHSGMILGARSIGNDVHIRQSTTFGVARRGDHRSKKPIIEDRVDIGAGVVIAGGITIGHDSVIGANAVVLKDVPPWSLVVGIPGKVIKSLDPNQPTQPS